MEGLSEPLYQAFLERAYRLGYTAVEYESKSQPVEFYKGREYICSLMPDGTIHFKPDTGMERDVHRLSNILLSMKHPYALYADAAICRTRALKTIKYSVSLAMAYWPQGWMTTANSVL